MEVREANAAYQVAPAYKQTEVGLIPADWEVKRLGDIAVVRDGTHQTPRYVSNGVPFYSVEQVTSGDFTNTKFISDEEHKFLTRTYKIEKNDILMTRIGSIGECKLIDWDADASFYVSLALLKVKGASPAYVAQYSNSSAFKTEVELHSLQSAIPKKINLGPISEVKVAFPSEIKEQERIASVLGDADALIEALEELLAKKRQIKQGAMQELLTGHRRLPGFASKWQPKKLDALCQMKSGEGITSEKIDDFSDYRCFGGNGLRGFTKTFTHSGTYALIGRQGALCGNVLIASGEFFASEHAIVVTPNRETDIHWLAFVLTRMNLNQYTESSAQPGLSVTKLLLLECVVPEKAEQTAIATVLADMDADIAALEAKLAKARELKQGMMQQLLTGRIRLV